jgi:hypothetical protein
LRSWLQVFASIGVKYQSIDSKGESAREFDHIKKGALKRSAFSISRIANRKGWMSHWARNFIASEMREMKEMGSDWTLDKEITSGRFGD